MPSVSPDAPDRPPTHGQVGDLVERGRRRLRAAGMESPARESRLLLAHVLERDEVRILTGDRDLVDPAHTARFEALIERRAAGEPVAYLRGVREFFGRDFQVDARVLVPRPETEHLVEAALALDLPADARVLDVGVGSGAIAVTLALERPGWRVTATDVSPGALAVARVNARRLGARVRLVATDVSATLRLGEFDLLVSNPPYLAPDEAADISHEVKDFEPAEALFAPDRGLAVLERILVEARSLQPGSFVIVEIGHRQEPELRRLEARQSWRRLAAITDYQGVVRTLTLTRCDGGD